MNSKIPSPYRVVTSVSVTSTKVVITIAHKICVFQITNNDLLRPLNLETNQRLECEMRKNQGFPFLFIYHCNSLEDMPYPI